MYRGDRGGSISRGWTPRLASEEDAGYPPKGEAPMEDPPKEEAPKEEAPKEVAPKEEARAATPSGGGVAAVRALNANDALPVGKETEKSSAKTGEGGDTRKHNESAWGSLAAIEKAPAPEEHNLGAAAFGKETGYAKLVINEPEDFEFTAEAAQASQMLLKCLEIRKKYCGPAAGERVEPDTVTFEPKPDLKKSLASILSQFDGDCSLSMTGEGHRMVWNPFAGTPPAADPDLQLDFRHGVFWAGSRETGSPLDLDAIVPVGEFCSDYVQVLQATRSRACISFVAPRLYELSLKYDLHTHRNSVREARCQKLSNGRDWFQVRKVDTHIHHSACFTQKQLMMFIRKKMKTEMDTVVLVDNGKPLTLHEVFASAGVDDEDDVTADSLCCMASLGGTKFDTFGRFDVFNTKYNPFGDKRLRDIFMKSDNHIEGRFLAELTKEVMAHYSHHKFVCAEWRISIYGRNAEEWAKLAKWFRQYDIQCKQVRWLIQVPRLYSTFRKIGAVKNFAEMMWNIFQPLFEASLDPASNEDMFFMLQQVVGFDSVDDESQSSSVTLKHYPSPEDWTDEANPPYTYWMYHMYANIRSLNALRRKRGLNTFSYRPHCGEAGSPSHLVSGFMLAESVCHGVNLKKDMVLQYLYYLAQVGLAVSPLSNDILFIPLAESPFGEFFKRGLNVSLSTDDPLIIHLTEEALIEEYVVAARSFRLSTTDLCEIARMSVLQSGFERHFKEWWVGSKDAGAEGNDELKSNVPDIRLRFRADCLRHEHETLAAAAGRLGSLCGVCAE
mmetsp:Transcript_12798/g.38060  ORF Transcript_12798/g.38060 Transcript_12798/m.38060 type:complete len:782 (+) Transcript_12798:28-2373(+)